jgi:hypothetical protein
LSEAYLLVGDADRAIEVATGGRDRPPLPPGDPEQVLLALIRVDALVQSDRSEEAVRLVEEIMASSESSAADRRWLRRLERLRRASDPDSVDSESDLTPRDALDEELDRRWMGPGLGN